jgi:double zinc ribbon protein
MLPLAYFGIESSGLNLVVDLLILFVVVLYLSLIYWTYADARRRILDPMLVGCATAASLFPFVGTIVYMILRPPEYIEDVRERDLEVQAAEARLHEFDHALCPHCDYRIERDFVRCPSCLRKLKERCVNCSRPLDQAWTICPYCETEVAAAAPPRTRRRRTAAAAAVEAEHAPELASTRRPETARAKAARERKERQAGGAESDVAEEIGEDQDTRATPVVASEPAANTRSGGRAGGRTRPST